MTSITYQVIIKESVDFNDEIISILKNTYEESYDKFDDDKLESAINIKYISQIDENSFLIGFEVFFKDGDEYIESLIVDFGNNLKDSEQISLVLKYSDDYSYLQLSQIYEMLYSLEMKMREVISLIFIDTYKSDYYNLLRDFDLKPRYEGKNNLQKDSVQRAEFLGKRFENEFFHLLFSEYLKLSTPKNLEHRDLYFIAEISSNFEEFKNNILKRGVTKTEYVTFIENIKPLMDNIHRIRNCVAHNRSLSEEDQRNYQTYFDRLNQYINELLKNIETDVESPRPME